MICRSTCACDPLSCCKREVGDDGIVKNFICKKGATLISNSEGTASKDCIHFFSHLPEPSGEDTIRTWRCEGTICDSKKLCEGSVIRSTCSIEGAQTCDNSEIFTCKNKGVASDKERGKPETYAGGLTVTNGKTTITKSVHTWKCPHDIFTCKKVEIHTEFTPYDTVCKNDSTRNECLILDDDGSVTAGHIGAVAGSAEMVQRSCASGGPEKIYIWQCYNSKGNKHCSKVEENGCVRAKCGCGTAARPCSPQGSTLKGKVKSVEASCGIGSAKKVTKSWTCESSDNSCSTNTTCSEVTATCPAVTCAQRRGTKGHCSDNSSVTASSTDNGCQVGESGNNITYTWQCGTETCDDTLDTCHVPPECDSSIGDCTAGTTSDDDPTPDTTACTGAGTVVSGDVKTYTWNCSNDGKLVKCDEEVDTCVYSTKTRCSCTQGGGCSVGCTKTTDSCDGKAGKEVSFYCKATDPSAKTNSPTCALKHTCPTKPSCACTRRKSNTSTGCNPECSAGTESDGCPSGYIGGVVKWTCSGTGYQGLLHV